MTSYQDDSRAFILGGSCELAIGLAKCLVAKGLHPTLTHRSDGGKSRIDEALKAAEGQYTCFPLDLGNVDTLASLDPVLADGVDYWVDFAQGDLEGLVASTDMGAVASYFKVNIANRAEVIQRVSRAMIAQRKGRMVFVSSVAAGQPNPGQGFYAAAKQACEALYRSVGLELASRGVTTVTLRPGYVGTGRGHHYLEKNAGTALAKVPLGRALKTHEVVDTLMFLLSDSAQGFNATVLTMDGGLSAGK
jgi:3-oxoacyl-[acyl-carrier protein] reductase